MYENCLQCKKLGAPCDGPNFLAMSTTELVEWCNTRRKQLGLTYDRIADMTNLSKGTVSGFFNATHADYRLETIRPILKLLVGGEWGDSPCADPTDTERAGYEARITHLEGEVAWRDDKIQHLTQSNSSMQQIMDDTNKRHAEQVEFLRRQLDERANFMRRKDKAIVILSVLLALCVVLIIAALIIDRSDGSIGFFWLEGLFRPNSFVEVFNNWRT